MPLIQLPPIVVNPDFVLQPTLSSRLRWESRTNRDFRDSVSDRKDDTFFRIRPGIQAKYKDKLSATLEYQYAHNRLSLPKSKSSDDFSDMSLGFVRFAEKGVAVTAGRQKIALGSERLIGPLEWANTARSFDGLRVQGGRWDAFGFEVGVQQPRPLTDARFYGASYSSRFGLTYGVHKESRLKGVDTEITTIAHHWQRPAGGWQLEAEVAGQAGKIGRKDLEAWAWHLQAGRPLDAKTKVWVEANAASGGSNGDTVRTFDNLLPTNHKFYGSMDLQAWRNLNELSAGLAHKPNKEGEIRLHGHWFSLRDASDAWYGASGAPLKRDATGKSGRDVGWELDLEYAHQLDAKNQFHVGFGLFAPGKFTDRLTVGKADNQTWFYLSWSLKL